MRDKMRRKLRLHLIPPGPRRWLVGVVGGMLLFIGLAMVVLPGPAFIVIPLGLALLATEFQWAERYLGKMANLYKSAKNRITHRKNPSS